MGLTLRAVSGLTRGHGIGCRTVHNRLPSGSILSSKGSCSVSTSLGELPSVRSGRVIIMLSEGRGATSVVLPTNTSLLMGGRIPNVGGAEVNVTLGGRNIGVIDFCGTNKDLTLGRPGDCCGSGRIAIDGLGRFALLPLRALSMTDRTRRGGRAGVRGFRTVRSSRNGCTFFVGPRGRGSFSVCPVGRRLGTCFGMVNGSGGLRVRGTLTRGCCSVTCECPSTGRRLVVPGASNVSVDHLRGIEVYTSGGSPGAGMIVTAMSKREVRGPVSGRR